jgi:hypothetical protein
MEELRVTNLLGGALAAISGAVIASFFGVFGILTGAGVMSIFMAVTTAGYAHSLATAHRWLRRTLRRKAGGETEASTPPAQPVRWPRVALAAAAVFAVAMGAVTTVEATAGRPLASLLGSAPSLVLQPEFVTWLVRGRAGERSRAATVDDPVLCTQPKIGRWPLATA